jgi:hypothetical protein
MLQRAGLRNAGETVGNRVGDRRPVARLLKLLILFVAGVAVLHKCVHVTTTNVVPIWVIKDAVADDEEDQEHRKMGQRPALPRGVDWSQAPRHPMEPSRSAAGWFTR